MVHVSEEARRLFDKDSRALWREAMGLLSRLDSRCSAGRAPSPEARSLVRRFLHALHSLKGLLAMLPETMEFAQALQSLEGRLSFRAAEDLVAGFDDWSAVAREALLKAGGGLALDAPAGAAFEGAASNESRERSHIPSAEDASDGAGDESGWVVHLEEEGVLRSLWVSAARVDHWEDVPGRQAVQDLEMGWSLQEEGWTRVLGARPAENGTARAVVLSVRPRGGAEAAPVMIYTGSVEWLVPRDRARLQGLETLEDWVRRRLSSFGEKGSITPMEDTVETPFDVGTREEPGTRAA